MLINVLINRILNVPILQRQRPACLREATASILQTVRNFRFGSPITFWHLMAPVRSWLCLLMMNVTMNLPKNLICRSNRLLKAATLKKQPTRATASISIPAFWMDSAKRKPSTKWLNGLKKKASARRKSTTVCVTGHFLANATGANRFRLFIGKTVKQRLFLKTSFRFVCQKQRTSSHPAPVKVRWQILTTG